MCAVLIKDGKYLVVQRSDKMKLPNKWEFPGGKIEPHESERQCIVREIKEELNILIKPIKRLTPNKHWYGSTEIELIPYIVGFLSGNIRLIEHSNFKFVSEQELSKLDWAAADIPIVNEILKK